MTVTAVRHAGVVVEDMERSLAFWCDQLGLTVAADAQESGPFLETILALPGVEVRTVKLAAPEGPTLVELLHFREGPSARPELADLRRLGPTHVALTVTGLRDLHERLTAAGTPFLSEPQTSVDGRALVAFCADPDGTMVELVEPL